MAKNKTVTTTTSTSNPAPAEPVPQSMAADEAPAENTSTELAPVAEETTEIVEAHPDSLAELVPLLPHKEKRLLAIRKVRAEEFEAVLQKLPDAAKLNFQDLMDRMNPERDTRETGTPKFRPAALRLYQGVGEKPKNPKLPKGGVEDGAGNIILVPEAFKEDFEGIPQKLIVSVLFIANGRAYWPARDAQGQPVIPAGIEIKGNQMICGSADRIVGSRYGDCATCAYKPDFNKKEAACKDNVDLFVARPDFSGVFQITVGATSFKSAIDVIEKKANSWKKDYAGQFALEPMLVEKPGKNYYAWKATPITSRTEANGVMNSPETQEMLSLLSRQIQTEAYYPRLAQNYARAKGNAENGEAGSLADVEKAAAGIDHSASTNNISV